MFNGAIDCRSVYFTAQGSVVVMPWQQPEKKQPMRPIAAIKGAKMATRSKKGRTGMLIFFKYHGKTINTPRTLPKTEKPPCHGAIISTILLNSPGSQIIESNRPPARPATIPSISISINLFSRLSCLNNVCFLINHVNTTMPNAINRP